MVVQDRRAAGAFTSRSPNSITDWGAHRIRPNWVAKAIRPGGVGLTIESGIESVVSKRAWRGDANLVRLDPDKPGVDRVFRLLDGFKSSSTVSQATRQLRNRDHVDLIGF